MKILIAYYSKTGQTAKLAQVLEDRFRKREHEVDVEIIKPVKEKSFFGWWISKLFKKDCEIIPLKINDVSKYDLICIGSPNWTSLSSPVVKYLKIVRGIKYKNIGFFATTFLLPQLEWYLFSAFLLDYDFASVVSKREGKTIDTLLLSSGFKRRSCFSEYGKKKIDNFCNNVEKLRYSFKDYYLKEKEVNIARSSLMMLSLLLVFVLAARGVLLLFNHQIFSWQEFSSLFTIGVFFYLSVLMILGAKSFLYLTKYVVSLAVLSEATIIIFFLAPELGKTFFTGAALIFILFSFFHDLKMILFSGAVSLLSYFFLLFNYPDKRFFSPLEDIISVLIITIIVGFVTQNLQKNRFKLLDAQDEAETARASLEIKIIARTRELSDLSRNLEAQVEERTRELEEKIDELERFNKLAVGRELRMINLKEEIRKLKGQLEKINKPNLEQKNVRRSVSKK
ncbi:MAG: hypothetical protein PHW72_00405 [Candidatus Pacebacteria bacterium]|nr:hypothetical protein [Candidatus Paceibacterota bacterium]